MRSALPSAVNRVEGRLRPRLFLLLDFQPNKSLKKLPKILPNLLADCILKSPHAGSFLFGRVFACKTVSLGTRAVCGRYRGISAVVFTAEKKYLFLFCRNGFSFGRMTILQSSAFHLSLVYVKGVRKTKRLALA